MPTSLVIVESPAKCKKIESYLGSDYKVIASFGHLRNISGIESIDINNNFNTKYSIINEEIKLKQIEKLRNEIEKSHEVIIATDGDREGEAIGWHICELFGLSVVSTKRIIFYEITETAIKTSILNPKRLNLDLVYSQQARQILDLLVGFTVSPVLWNVVSKTHNNSLSAGRCQTPALRIIYDNYIDIKKSQGKSVYNTFGYFTSLNLSFELNKKFNNENEIINFLDKCKTWNFMYSVTEPKKTIKKSPEPLTTSLLQQLSFNELNMSPKETMKCAQQLYECGYITYMRTDSKKYSNIFIDIVTKYIINEYGEKYVNQNINNFIITNEESKKNILIQEAHEAIRPVNIHVSSLKQVTDLYEKSIKLYGLIFKRTLESCMSSAQYNYINAKINAPFDTEFIYKSEQPILLGWKIVENNKKEDDCDTEYYQFLKNLKENNNIKPKKIESTFVIIELKSHYSEAKLVQILEEKCIGRPSTFASLVDKIQERKYVKKENISGKEIECNDFVFTDNIISQIVSKREFGKEHNRLVIQPLGIIVIEFLLEHFDTFFDYGYTKEMEENLDKIANGKQIWYNLCNICYNDLMNIINKVSHLNKFNVKIDENHTLIIGKYGPVIKYVDPKDNTKVSFIETKKNLDIEKLKNMININLETVIEKFNNDTSIGKYKGQDLFIKQGKYGIYAQWGKDKKSLKEKFGTSKIEDIKYIDVIRYLDNDTILDPSKPVNLVRELNKHWSIRNGKYGDYIFFKKPHMKKPEFYKLKDFTGNYNTCDKNIVINWIKEKYSVNFL